MFGPTANVPLNTNSASGCGSTWSNSTASLANGASCSVVCTAGNTATVATVYCDANTFKDTDGAGVALVSPGWWICAGEIFV